MEVYTKQTIFGTFRSDRKPTFMRILFTFASVIFYVSAFVVLLWTGGIPPQSFFSLLLTGIGIVFSILKKKLNDAYQGFLWEVEDQRKEEKKQIENDARIRDEIFLANNPVYKRNKSPEQIRTIRILTDIRDMCKKYIGSSDGDIDREELESLYAQLRDRQLDDCEEIMALRAETDNLVELCGLKEKLKEKQNEKLKEEFESICAQLDKEFDDPEEIMALLAKKDNLAELCGLKDEQISEHHMRCNVCGHIFCYTDDDLNQNAKNAGMGLLSSIGVFASLFAGTIFHTHHLQGQADRYEDKIVNYRRCPSCHSIDISEMKDREEIKQPSNTVISENSPFEEIKKYKELLDMGIITQEEFDAKKKQLLGL